VSWGTKIEIERRNRIRLAMAAYSYEFHSHSIMSDGEYDELSKHIDTNVVTGHKVMDKFFKKEFSLDTGMWIHRHPELNKIKVLYERLYK
jgi:hypothetical protein